MGELPAFVLSESTDSFGTEQVVAWFDDGLTLRRRYKNERTGGDWRTWEDVGISLTAEEAAKLLGELVRLTPTYTTNSAVTPPGGREP